MNFSYKEIGLVTFRSDTSITIRKENLKFFWKFEILPYQGESLRKVSTSSKTIEDLP